MILRLPSYYREFECIADRCRDSCCVGWEIDIDEETFAYYREITGPFGDRLRANMTSGEENSFRLKAGNRCPFLNDRNLCDIVLTLGETSLCEICTEYPRFTLEYGDVREKCLGISCEEVGRILFEKTGKITFEESETREEYPGEEYSEEEYAGEEAQEDDDEDYRGEVRLGEILSGARDRAISILQDRSRPVEERICRYLRFAEAVQKCLNDEEPERMAQLWEKDGEDGREEGRDGVAPAKGDRVSAGESFPGREAFFGRKKILEGMEILDEEWRDAIAHVEDMYRQRSEEECRQMLREFMEFYRSREHEYEHLMVYFTFRYAMKAVFDCGFLAKAQLAVLSFLTIRDMDAVRFADQKGCFSLGDRVDTARIYSKEVEHSEDNLEYLADAFLFEENLTSEALCRQVLWGLK